MVFAIETIAVGIGVGVLSGAFGLGGGVLMVPAFMTFVAGMDAHTATGTSLFVMCFVAAQNAWRINRALDAPPWREAAVLAIGSVAGGYAGSELTVRLPESVVLGVFLALIAALAFTSFFGHVPPVDQHAVRRRDPLAVAIGFLAGAAGGATGTGGGAVMIPLALRAGIVANSHVVGMSNLVIVVSSLAGIVPRVLAEPVYASPWSLGQIYLPLAPLVFLGAQIGSPAGRALNRRMTLRGRRNAMGVMLAIIAAQLLYRMLA